jgi:ectoine hydroxylase-related dioxygenase (phytanoyl-CoA dioxygenase family)
MTVTSTDAESFARRFDEVGYVVFRDIVPTEPLQMLAEQIGSAYEEARCNGALFAGGGRHTGHLNCFPGETSRFVYDALVEHGIVDLVRAVRPDIVESVRATMNLNLPGSVAQHYHADGLYTREFIICNVAVIDTDLHNGAIDVLPGTHSRFYKFWRYAAERKFRLTTRIPMRQGDVLVRRSTLWHRGMPNQSPSPRPMMAVTFGENEPGAGDPFLVNDGALMFFPNWYNTSRLGQLRERAYVKAPITYSAYRFARSLYGNKGYSSW